MSEDRRQALKQVLEELELRLDEAARTVQSRPEWKSARALVDVLAASSTEELDLETVDDRVREAEAARDLLDIASSEVRQQEQLDERLRAERLAEDQRLLMDLNAQCVRYRNLVVISFVMPLFFVTWPAASRFVLLCLVPVLIGFGQMRAQSQQLEGRIWRVLQARVDEARARVRMLHWAALAAALATLLWFVIALFAMEARAGG